MSLTVGILWRAAEYGCVHPTDTFSIPQRKLLTELSEISSFLLNRTWKIGKIGGKEQKNTAEAAQPWYGETALESQPPALI